MCRYNKIVSLILITILSIQSFAQSSKNSLHINFNPVGALSTSKTEGIGATEMQEAQLGFGIGLTYQHKLNKQWNIGAFFKYNTQKQRVIQEEFYGALLEGSFLSCHWEYNNYQLGFIASYQMFENRKIKPIVMAGLSYTILTQYGNRINNSYKVFLKENETLSIRYGSGKPLDNFDNKASYINGIIGIKIPVNIKRIGQFHFGLIGTLPFGKMPIATLESEIKYNNNTYITKTTTQSRQYLAELLIQYQIFNW